MKRVEPHVFCIGETRKNEDELRAYLEYIGVPEWQTTDVSDVEEIVEINSRGCYLSFGTGLNANLTRVREGNEAHLANVITSGHGSVMEHSFANFEIVDVSRVFTHEAVRHRTGTSISQESLRYVRLDNMGLWIPPCYADYEPSVTTFEHHWAASEEAYQSLVADAPAIENRFNGYDFECFDDMPMSMKKRYTSAARRVAPIGLATKVGWGCNMRSLRNILIQRTDAATEEEMRTVFAMIGHKAMARWPNLFQDFRIESVFGIDQFIAEKV